MEQFANKIYLTISILFVIIFAYGLWQLNAATAQFKEYQILIMSNSISQPLIDVTDVAESLHEMSKSLLQGYFAIMLSGPSFVLGYFLLLRKTRNGKLDQSDQSPDK